MSSAKPWRKGEIEAMAKEIAEKVFDEKIKALKNRVDELEKKPSVYDDLTKEEIEERLLMGGSV